MGYQDANRGFYLSNQQFKTPKSSSCWSDAVHVELQKSKEGIVSDVQQRAFHTMTAPLKRRMQSVPRKAQTT